MCGGGVRSILLLHLVARFMETRDVCKWRLLRHTWVKAYTTKLFKFN